MSDKTGPMAEMVAFTVGNVDLHSLLLPEMPIRFKNLFEKSAAKPFFVI